MRYLVSILIASLTLLIFSLTPLLAGTRTDVTITVEGVERQFIVVRPVGTPPSGGYPVVFMFHGTSGDGEKFYNISGWKEKGDAENIVTIFPSSLRYCIMDNGQPHQTTKWNNGDLQDVACLGQTFKSDVLFIRTILDTVASILPIDRQRVYASGFSNGGTLAGKLSIEASDIFAAIACSSGSLHTRDSGAPLRNIPIIWIVGDHDDRFTEAFGITQIPFNDSALFYMRGQINRFIDAFDLSEDYTRTETALTLSYRFATSLPGTTAREFTFVLVKDLAHQYANGTNHPLSSADQLWEWFSSFTVADVDPDRSAPGVALPSIHPNPARTHLRVSGTDVSRLVLRSVRGDMVLDVNVGAEGIVVLPPISSGLYLAEIHTRSGVHSTTVVVQR